MDKRICDDKETSLFLDTPMSCLLSFNIMCILPSNTFFVVLCDEHKKESREESRR